MYSANPAPAPDPGSTSESLVIPERCTVVNPLPFSRETLTQIEDLCRSVSFQPSIANRGSHYLLRRNNCIAGVKPEILEINKKLLTNPELIDLFQRHFGERLKVHGAQINCTAKGEDLPAHTHAHDDRFAVLHLGLPYTGGRYYEVDSVGFKRFPEIPPYSLVLNRGSICHGVEEVTSDSPRLVIVMFLEPDTRPQR